MTASARLKDALAWATDLHGDQKRKGTDIPYLSHVLGVASIVMELGGDADDTIAALLHDAVEDAGVAFEQIEERYGPRVRRLVESATDTLPNDGDRGPETWRPRKQQYLDHLAAMAPDERRLAIADKLHNARSIAADRRRLGDGVWTRFKAGRDEQLWYYGALAATLSGGGSEPEVEELAAIVTAFGGGA